MLEEALFREWLETDGTSGFAMGTTSGIRTRRYHGLLCAAPPGFGRLMLVSGLEVSVTNSHGKAFLSTEEYQPDVVHPDGYRRIEASALARGLAGAFVWTTGARSRKRSCACARRARRSCASSSSAVRARPSSRSGRSSPGGTITRFRAKTPRSPSIRSGCRARSCSRPYASLPRISLRSNGRYAHGPLFYRAFRYREEAERGLDHVRGSREPGCARVRPRERSPLTSRSAICRIRARRASSRGALPSRALVEREAARRASVVVARAEPRSLRGRERRPAHHHRRLSVVHRLGP